VRRRAQDGEHAPPTGAARTPGGGYGEWGPAASPPVGVRPGGARAGPRRMPRASRAARGGAFVFVGQVCRCACGGERPHLLETGQRVRAGAAVYMFMCVCVCVCVCLCFVERGSAYGTGALRWGVFGALPRGCCMCVCRAAPGFCLCDPIVVVCTRTSPYCLWWQRGWGSGAGAPVVRKPVEWPGPMRKDTRHSGGRRA